MSTKYDSVDAYLASVPSTHRGALEALRAQIRRLCPEATEHISYNAPLFKLDGHPLVAFRDAKRHCALFVWSGTALGTLGDLLDGYDTAMSTVRFTPDKPLPEHIVKAVVDARAKEIEERWGRKGARKSPTPSGEADRRGGNA